MEGFGTMNIYVLGVWEIHFLVSWIFQVAELSGHIKGGKDEGKAEMDVL